MAGSTLRPDGAGEDAQRDREQGVADRHDALHVEDEDAEPALFAAWLSGLDHQDMPSP